MSVFLAGGIVIVGLLGALQQSFIRYICSFGLIWDWESRAFAFSHILIYERSRPCIVSIIKWERERGGGSRDERRS
jgi:hypothetical protein